MTGPIFSEERNARLERAIEPAIGFLEGARFKLGAAWVRHRWRGGEPAPVVTELEAFQQQDGGFAGLEIDIKAPVSTAFDGRLAMHVLLTLPNGGSTGAAKRLGDWYAHNQHDDGDWHFSPAVYDHQLAPWFAAWDFPTLNPACCVAGLTHALGVATPDMLEKVERIWSQQATLDQVRSGDFYPMLPIIEYVAHVDVQDRDTWLDAIATGIERGIAANSFGDAEHALEHIIGSGPDVLARLDRDDVVKVIDAVLADQQDDGGWPTPYDQDWRSWFTASTLVLLSKLREVVV